MKNIITFAVFIFAFLSAAHAQRTTTSSPDTLTNVVEEAPIIINVKKDKTDEDMTFTKVEIDPHFKGGAEAWLKYVKENTKPSGYKCHRGIYSVIVKFRVDQKGKAGDFHTETHFDCSIEKEALRIVQSVPEWIPGMQNGSIVKAYVRLEVPIRID